jgi:hypothetical protein
MTRLTQRLSTMFSAVKCPRCGMLVQPDSLPAPEGPPDSPGPANDEKRWSFLWVAPRGDVCPECEFPLSKYFGRLKWIRTAGVGVSIVIVSLVFQNLAGHHHLRGDRGCYRYNRCACGWKTPYGAGVREADLD